MKKRSVITLIVALASCGTFCGQAASSTSQSRPNMFGDLGFLLESQ